MGLFKSKEEKARLSNLKNIISVSMADGELGEDELTIIALAAARDNISERDVEKMLEGQDQIHCAGYRRNEDALPDRHGRIDDG